MDEEEPEKEYTQIPLEVIEKWMKIGAAVFTGTAMVLVGFKVAELHSFKGLHLFATHKQAVEEVQKEPEKPKYKKYTIQGYEDIFVPYTATRFLNPELYISGEETKLKELTHELMLVNRPEVYKNLRKGVTFRYPADWPKPPDYKIIILKEGEQTPWILVSRRHPDWSYKKKREYASKIIELNRDNDRYKKMRKYTLIRVPLDF